MRLYHHALTALLVCAALPLLVAFAPGCGGVATDGGSDAGGAGAGGAAGASGVCNGGTVTFSMKTSGGGPGSYCVGEGCGGTWISIATAAGDPIDLERDCITDCGACQPVACPNLCAAPRPTKPEGEQTTWDGTYWPKKTCGAGISCADQACATPGKYVATMCATSNAIQTGGFCNGGGMSTCVDVPFVYPTSAIVEGTLPPAQ